MSSKAAGMRAEGLYTRARGAAGPLARRRVDMSRLTTIFRRRGGGSEPGQEAQVQPAAAPTTDSAPEHPGFADRGKLRRRLRYLRRVRELQLRDLGGLVYETHRRSRPRQDLVDRKVEILAATDAELSGLEVALDDRRPLRELREPGIGGQCPRCGELFGSDARFCSHCGAGLTGEAAAALGQFAGTPAAPPAGAPAVAAAPAAAAAAGAPASPAAPSVPAAAAAVPPPVRDLSASAGAEPTAQQPAAEPTTQEPAAEQQAPAAPQPPAPSPAPPPTSGPHPAARMPIAPSGEQGIASGDPLGQALPSSNEAEDAQPPMSSGDPLAAKPAPPTQGDPLAGPSEDETAVMRPEESAGSNGTDDAEAAKAQAARSPDESE
jgi:hypothetical protein